MSLKRVFRIALLACLLLTLAPAAHAIDFAIFGSYFDTDDLGNTYGGGLRLGLFNRFQLQLAGTFYDGVDERPPTPSPTSEEIKIDMTPFDAGFAFHFGPKATGFLLGGGLSYYVFEEDRREIDDELGYYGKAGYQFEHFFIEGMYRVIEGSLSDIVGGIVGDKDVSLDGITVNAGWRF